MTRKTFNRAVLLSLAMAVAACGNNQNKIGSTIKGDRISVIEQAKVLEPDKDLAEMKPSLPREIVNLSWPQAAYDSQNAVPNAQASTSPKILWKADIGAGSSSDFKLLAHPVASRGFIYTMDAEGRVRCLDAETGRRVWDVDTTPKESDEPAMGGGLAIDGDTLYATTGFGDVYALDLKSGKTKWQKSLLKPLRAAPAVFDNRIYVVSVDNDLNALDAADGQILWHQSGITESAALMGAASPAVQGDVVVVAYNSGELFGLRTQNGRVSWNYSLAAPAQVGALPAIADIRGLPVIDHGQVFAISHSGRIATIDQKTGDRIWESDIGGINTPVVARDAVFIYGGDNELIALTRATGRPIWVVKLQKNEDPEDKGSDRVVWTGPIMAGEKLWMVNSLGEFKSFSPQTGAAETKIDLGSAAYLSPIVANKTFYVVTDNGKLLALR
ncbi:MAG: PQQ-binding-like beta-propeller repeat protein [Alphaproteobacteria bacterium]|nr:PQQ-binding-like beta-propeller repeat protein [Alphaproteobacteria bacterium]